MKRFEKILIIVFCICFGLQLLDFSQKRILFLFTTWLLSVSYLVGGYWLLNPKKQKSLVIPIFAGLAFATALYSLPFNIWLNREPYFNFLPVANGLLFIFLFLQFLFLKSSEAFSRTRIPILFRSGIILILTVFFTYSPISLMPFRSIVYVLNRGEARLQNNILMHHYIAEYKKAFEKGNCNNAIKYALKANEAGKFWLGITEENLDTSSTIDITKHSNDKYLYSIKEIKSLSNSDLEQLDKIAGTYNNLYWAYKCQADNDYGKRRFNEALKNYETAHYYLQYAANKTKYWNGVKSHSLNKIALCYRNLAKYSIADSLFLEAIEIYKINNNTEDPELAYIISNLAFSLSEELQFEQANKLFRMANFILEKQTPYAEKSNDLISNYNSIAKNYLQQDSVGRALFFINKAFKVSGSKNLEKPCETLVYYGISYYKLNKFQKADSVLNSCFQCYEKFPKTHSQNIAECSFVMSQVNIALAKYDKAKTYLSKGLSLTKKNYGHNSSRYANYLRVFANLNKITAEYSTAEKQYKAVINIYKRELGEKNSKLPTVLSGLADLEVVLSKLDSAKVHSNESLSMASNFLPLSYPSTTDLLNEAAYVNYNLELYKIAEAQYLKVIAVNNNFGIHTSVTTATALNGLGLIEYAKNNYKNADSLFLASLNMYESIFTINHPLPASVYLNLGRLNMDKGNLDEAEIYLDNALQTYRKFYKNEHTIFGDIYVALGDLALNKKQNDLAKRYYNKALTTYQKLFNDSHWKVTTTRQRVEVKKIL
ncbi:MAG: tetratricopeptide repeat protein [Adhaeribacter sp.]